jgi:spore germination protein YaaH
MGIASEVEGIRIVPTLLWTDAGAMHRILSDPRLRAEHIERIISLLNRHNFPGVDIDYEGKDAADREHFSQFLRDLHERLASQHKTLACTVEARTQDDPPADWVGARAMSYANDFGVLGSVCDEVRLMAYDQMFQEYRAKSFELPSEESMVSNAGLSWVESVAQYALRSIPAEKIMLGVPTYGWEFRQERTETGIRFTRVRAVSYPQAVARAREGGVTLARDAGGELGTTVSMRGQTYRVVVSDAQAIGDKIALAERLHLRGVSLFKIDGQTDPQLFDRLKESR